MPTELKSLILVLLVLLAVPEPTATVPPTLSLGTVANKEGLRPILLLPTDPRGLLEFWLDLDEILSDLIRSSSSGRGPSARALSSSCYKNNYYKFIVLFSPIKMQLESSKVPEA